MVIQLSDIVTPDGQDPARWRARKAPDGGTELVCGARFVAGVTPEPITDRQARRLIAALGDAVTVEPWGRPARRIDVLSPAVQARVLATIERFKGTSESRRFGMLLEPIPADLELPDALETQRFEAHVVMALDDADALAAELLAEPAPFIEGTAGPDAASPPDVPAESLPAASPDSRPDVAPAPTVKPEGEPTRQTHRKKKS